MERQATFVMAEILRRFPQTGDVREVTFPQPGFSGAVIARASTAAGKYCLRGWPADSLPVPRIRGLHRLLAHIARQQVDCVAVPLVGDGGDTLVRHQGRLWQLEPWLPGRADYWDHPSEARLRSAMRRLADWHRAAASFVPRDVEADWFSSHPGASSPAVLERRQRIGSLPGGGCRRLAAQLSRLAAGEFRDLGQRILRHFPPPAAAVAAELDRMSDTRFRLQPCLRDIWHDHLLFTGDEVSGLIDPTACRTENVATDLARLLGSLVEDEAGQWNLALAAYQQHCPLTVDELALVQRLDQSSVVLAGITWIERGCRGEIPPADSERVLQRLRVIERRLHRLARTL